MHFYTNLFQKYKFVTKSARKHKTIESQSKQASFYFHRQKIQKFENKTSITRTYSISKNYKNKIKPQNTSSLLKLILDLLSIDKMTSVYRNSKCLGGIEIFATFCSLVCGLDLCYVLVYASTAKW